MSNRMQKVGSVIQREVAQLFAEVLDESEYGLATVVRVEVLDDLSEARIFVSALQNATDFVTMLNRRAGYLRRIVGPRLFLKKIPKFRFFADQSGSEAERLEILLRKGVG